MGEARERDPMTTQMVRQQAHPKPKAEGAPSSFGRRAARRAARAREEAKGEGHLVRTRNGAQRASARGGLAKGKADYGTQRILKEVSASKNPALQQRDDSV